MALTPEQLQTFRAALYAETDPELVEYRTTGATGRVAEWYNKVGASAPIVWKTSLQLEEITSNGFDWVRVDNLSVGKARIWEWMFGSEDKSINPSKPNIRAGIAEVWKGTAADLAVQAVVLGHCKRPATRIEALFATGLGTVESPSTLVVVDQLRESEVDAAMVLQG